MFLTAFTPDRASLVQRGPDRLQYRRSFAALRRMLGKMIELRLGRFAELMKRDGVDTWPPLLLLLRQLAPHLIKQGRFVEALVDTIVEMADAAMAARSHSA